MDILPLIFYFLVIIPSAIFHEYAHGWMADRLGDPTARYAGRLSLNPLVHIDKWGTLLMPLILFVVTGGRFLFAYAKPVPYNPYNLKNQKWGGVAVGMAGPAANLLLAIVFGMVIRFLPASNLSMFLSIIVYANVLLAIFNLVPIPPLDGSKLLFALMPNSQYKLMEIMNRYGFIVLLAFVFFGFQLITPIINFVYSLIVGGAGYF